MAIDRMKELQDRCKQLGISAEPNGFRPSSNAIVPIPVTEPELERRIGEKESHIRENRLWWVALASAVASGISAATALWAVIAN